jgi:hypothetical protein
MGFVASFQQIYRLEIHSLMFVLLTHVASLTFSLMDVSPPPFLSALHAYIHGKYKGGGWSESCRFTVRNVVPIEHTYQNCFKLQCHHMYHMYFTFLTQCPTLLKILAWTWELVTQLPEST